MKAKTKSLAKWLIDQPPLVIAHRGFSRAAPENTLPAFAAALAAGAHLVELDARVSHDGQVIVIHDGELDRTTDAVRRWASRHHSVSSKTADEIQSLDAGAWFHSHFAGTRIPLLSEAIAFIRAGSIPLIECKAGDWHTYLNFLRERNLTNEVIVQSFNWDLLHRLHEAEPGLLLAALGPAHLLVGGRKPLGISRKLNSAWLNQVGKTGARIVVWTRQVSKGSVRLAHERGLMVWVYTINEVRLARKLLKTGANGLITNDPELIGKVVSAHEAPGGR